MSQTITGGRLVPFSTRRGGAGCCVHAHASVPFVPICAALHAISVPRPWRLHSKKRQNLERKSSREFLGPDHTASAADRPLVNHHLRCIAGGCTHSFNLPDAAGWFTHFVSRKALPIGRVECGLIGLGGRLLQQVRWCGLKWGINPRLWCSGPARSQGTPSTT
jgi:hypothetical protein